MTNTVTGTPIDRDAAKAILGEGFHTSFRKAIPDDGYEVWDAINCLDPVDWGSALEFVIDGLKSMGIELVEVEQ